MLKDFHPDDILKRPKAKRATKKDSTVVAFPDRPKVKWHLPQGYDSTMVYCVTLASNLWIHVGLHKGDFLLIDPEMIPKNGDIVVIKDEKDTTGQSVALYVKGAMDDTPVKGVIIGLQRLFSTDGLA